MGQGQSSQVGSQHGPQAQRPIAPDVARKPNRVTARELVSACTLVLALGMLIWLKLRLVANVPRTAYAQPMQQIEPAKPETTKAEDTQP